MITGSSVLLGFPFFIITLTDFLQKVNQQLTFCLKETVVWGFPTTLVHHGIPKRKNRHVKKTHNIRIHFLSK